MPRNVTVVVSQSPQQSPGCRDLEESLVATLLMEDGAEVNVIPHLAQLDEGSTGQLCLEGITGDMILASWLPTQDAIGELKARGITGRRGASRLDGADRPNAAHANGASPTGNGNGNGNANGNGHGLQVLSGGRQRAIYFIQLDVRSSMDEVRGEIRRIRSEASVQTVSLTGLVPAPDSRAAVPAIADPVSDTSEENRSESKPEMDLKGAQPTLPTLESQPTSPAQPVTVQDYMTGDGEEDGEEALEHELDGLMDQLEQLDL